MRKHTLKRISAGVTAILLGTGLMLQLPASVFAAADGSGTTADGFDYTIQNDTAVITGYSAEDKDSVTKLNLPETIGSIPVTEIGSNAFRGMKTVTEITLPDTLEHIGVSALEETAISELKLPASLKSIRADFLSGCENLKEITIPKELPINALEYSKWQGGWGATFKGSYIETFILEDGIEYVPNVLTMGDEHFKEIVIPDSVTTIGRGAFQWQTFESFSVPEGVTEIDSDAFYGAEQLTEIKLPSTLEKLGSTVFQNTSIENISLPEGLREVGSSVFADCKNLKAVTIPSTIENASEMLKNSLVEQLTFADGIVNIPPYIAIDAAALQTVELPRSVTNLGTRCFARTNITEFTVPKQIIKADTPFSEGALTDIFFEDGLAQIPNTLLRDAIHLNAIHWNASLTEIGDYCFYNCPALETVEIPDTIQVIGYEAFRNCKGIRQLRLPDCAAKIGSFAFAGCTALESVLVPQMATAADGTYENRYNERQFDGAGLKKIEFAAGITRIPNGICQSCESLTEIVFPENLLMVGKNAFAYCKALENVSFPDCITEIGENAFDGCANLKTLHLPAEISAIGNYAFRNTTALKSVTLPHQLTAYGGNPPFENSGIEQVAFAGGMQNIGNTFAAAPHLRTVEIPDSVTEIGNNAFANCPQLTSVKLPPNLKHLGGNAFAGCTALTNITIPKTLTTCGWSVFPSTNANVSGLTEITFESGMTSIPEGLCRDAENLRVAHIPYSVTEIQDMVFSGCKQLITLDMKQDSVAFGAGAFEKCDNLFDKRVDIYEKENTFAARVVSAAGSDGLMHYTVYYKLNPRFAEEYSNSALDIRTASSNPIDGKSLPQGLLDGESSTTHLKLDLTEQEGVFRFSTRPKENADTAVDIQYAMQWNNKPGWSYKRILTDNDAVPRLSLSAPAAASLNEGKAEINVFGFAAPADTVELYANGEVVQTVEASPYTGKYTATLQISAEDGGVIRLSAKTETAESEVTAVLCRSGQNEVKRVMLTITGHKTITEDITECFTAGKMPCFAYNPRWPLHFEVTLADNDCALVAVASTVNGTVSTIPLSFDAQHGTWVGEGTFNPVVPGKLSILAIPTTHDPIIRSLNEDGSYEYTVNGQEYFDDPASETEDDDWAKRFVSEADPALLGADENSIMMRYQFAANGETGGIIHYEGKTDTVILDDGSVSAKDAAADPEQYGFTESGARMVDENGKVHVYYIRALGDEETIIANAEAITIGVQDEQKPKRIISKTARALWITAEAGLEGTVATAKSTTSGTVTLEKILGEEDADQGFFLSFTNELGSAKIGDWISEAGKKLGWGVKNLGDKVGNACTWLDMGKEVHTYYNQLEEITNSDAPYVAKHRDAVYAMSTTLVVSKVTNVAATTIGVGAVTLACGLTAPAIAVIGVIVGVGWGIGKALDFFGDRLQKIIRGEAELNCVGEFKMLIDPSGIAYEFLPGNPIENVKAELYYQDETGDAVLWNAEDFDQKNPQLTDKDGWFAWDVPEGLWQVRLTKEGYSDAQSDWLPVLPVQVGVNLNMTTKFSAQIADVQCDADAVTVRFNRHVQDASVTETSLYLTDALGTEIPCSITPIKETANDTDCSIEYRLTPLAAADFRGASVHLTAAVMTYAEIASQAETVALPIDLLYGDINADGTRSIADAVLLCRYLAEENSITDTVATAAGDLDSDGILTILDVRKLMQMLNQSAQRRI